MNVFYWKLKFYAESQTIPLGYIHIYIFQELLSKFMKIYGNHLIERPCFAEEGLLLMH